MCLAWPVQRWTNQMLWYKTMLNGNFWDSMNNSEVCQRNKKKEDYCKKEAGGGKAEIEKERKKEKTFRELKNIIH